jgi:hypothetical protein
MVCSTSDVLRMTQVTETLTTITEYKNLVMMIEEEQQQWNSTLRESTTTGTIDQLRVAQAEEEEAVKARDQARRRLLDVVLEGTDEESISNAIHMSSDAIRKAQECTSKVTVLKASYEGKQPTSSSPPM